MEARAGGAVRTRLRRSVAKWPSNGATKELPPAPIAAANRLDFLVPISAKKLATRCAFVQHRQKMDLRKLHDAAQLRTELKTSGGFDSLHPLQSLTINDL